MRRSERSSRKPAGSRAVIPEHSASRLLELQLRLDACDRLYNAEIDELRKQVAELAADYVRLYQTRASDSTPIRRRKARLKAG